MKKDKIFLLLSLFLITYCEVQNNSSSIIDIDVLQISYELAYKEYAIKVIIQTINDLDVSVSFPAKFKAFKSKEEFNLNCHNVTSTEIECYTDKDVKFDLKEKYYFYYNRGKNGKYTLEEKDIYEDFKQVNLIFKPEMYTDLVMYRDHRKVIGLNNRKIVGGGYLYLVRKNKKLLHKQKDGFNKIIELNNFIIHNGITDKIPPCSFASYKEAITRGYRIVDANIQFTKDKIPIICHQDYIENKDEQKEKIDNMEFNELKKINLGKKYEKKYRGEKIFTLEDLLILCKENNVLIELNLSNLNYQNYFENTNEYAKLIIDTIEKKDMMDSIIFDEASNEKIISKLQEIKKDISVSISNIKSKEDMIKMKDKYPQSKRVIYNLGDITNNKKLDKEAIEYALSIGKKVKAEIIDNFNIANNLFSLGVNFIKTNKLEPFLVDNEYEEPILLKCTQFDVLVDCRLGEEVKLYDNAIYNIYYTTNIYKLFEDIVDKPIAEFKYYDTKQLDDRFYTVKKFDFENGDIDLNITFAIKKGRKLKGKVGPNYDNVKDCYLYDFTCQGNNLLHISCKINKNKNVVKFNGNYSIHLVDYYSLNVTTQKETNSFFGSDNLYKKIIYSFILILFTFVVIFVAYEIYKIRNKNSFTRIKIDERALKDNN